MAPASDFYKSLALDCNSQQIAIDIFAFSGQFVDLVTMGEWNVAPNFSTVGSLCFVFPIAAHGNGLKK